MRRMRKQYVKQKLYVCEERAKTGYEVIVQTKGCLLNESYSANYACYGT